MSQGDIFREVEEDLRRDQMQDLARKYGPFLSAVIGLILVATGAFVYYQNWDAAQRVGQTAELTEILEEVGQSIRPDTEDLDKLAVFSVEARPGLALLARLHEAGGRIRAGERETAIAIYDGIAEDPEAPQVFRDLATVQSVLHQVDQAEPDSVIPRIEPLAVEGNPWRPMATELLALLKARAGAPEEAAALYLGLTGLPDAAPESRARWQAMADYFATSGE